MTNNGLYVTGILATAGVILSVYYLYSQKKKFPKPSEWRKVGTLKSISLYPVKSCGAVTPDEAECAILGLKCDWLRDRFLMVIDDKNNFITARTYPELLLVQPSGRSSVLTLKHKYMEPLNIDLAEVPRLNSPITAQVWGIEVPVYDCGLEASGWFSRILEGYGIKCRLVYYASQQSRKLRSKNIQMENIYKFLKNDTGALPDEVPFNIMNEASVEDLNSRLRNCQVTPRNFRPNFVVTGAKPYEEDEWKFIKIGVNIFEVIKPCTRCVLTTIDPETAIRNKDSEPLETLKSYRQIENPEVRRMIGTSPRLGLQISLRSAPGQLVSVGDDIYVA